LWTWSGGKRISVHWRDTVKKPATKPKRKNEPLLNANGMKFEDMVRKMVNTPPMPKQKPAKKS
jgi:hypothetical protein